MINLSNTSSTLSVQTSTTASIQVHTSWVDINTSSGAYTPGSINTIISSATTTPVVAAPGANTIRNIKAVMIFNDDASLSDLIEVLHYDGTNTVALYSITLPLESGLQYTDGGTGWTNYGGNYLGSVLFNQSTAAQGAGFATDTYVTGSSILLPSTRPKVGTLYRCLISASKTAAGTATPIIQLRYGAAASTADTSLCSFTFSAGTAATDVGMFEVIGLYRSVGSGAAAVIQGNCSLISQPTTGFSSLLKGVQTTSAGHDSTTANTYLGVSVNGGASAAWTVQLVQAQLLNFS